MFQANFPERLLIEPRPSRVLAAWVHGSHGVALAVSWAPGIGFWISLFVSVAVAVSWLHCRKQDLLAVTETAIRRAEWDSDGTWRLEGSDGLVQQARLLDGPFVNPRVVVLRFAVGRFRRRRWVLPRDALDHQTHRRLRVRLNLAASERPPGWKGLLQRFRPLREDA